MGNIKDYIMTEITDFDSMVDSIFTQFEDGKPISEIARDLDTDEYDIQMLMRKHRIRFQLARAQRAQTQTGKLQQIKKLADELALKRLTQFEKTVLTDNIPQQQQQKALVNLNDLIFTVRSCLDWFSEDRQASQDDNPLPFDIVFEDYEPGRKAKDDPMKEQDDATK